MKTKTPEDSRTVLSQVMMPRHASHYGNVHGGEIMKLVDEVAYVAASRHARKNVVTAAIDSLDFRARVYPGDVVTLRAEVIHTGYTSMEIEVSVETERIRTGEVLSVAEAHLVMVALDDEGKPSPVPGLELQTPDEQARYEQAEQRRRARLAGRSSP